MGIDVTRLEPRRLQVRDVVRDHRVPRPGEPDRRVQGRQGPTSPRLQKVWLFVLAITIHNFPEGLAVGVIRDSL